MLCLPGEGEVPIYSIFLHEVARGTLPAKEMMEPVCQAISVNGRELDSRLLLACCGGAVFASCCLLTLPHFLHPLHLRHSKAPITPPCQAFRIDFI